MVNKLISVTIAHIISLIHTGCPILVSLCLTKIDLVKIHRNVFVFYYPLAEYLSNIIGLFTYGLALLPKIKELLLLIHFPGIRMLYLCDLLHSLVLLLSLAFELGSKCNIYFSSSYCYEKSLIPKIPTLQQHLLHCTKKGRLVDTNTSMTVVAGTVQSLSYIHIRAPYIKLSLYHILQLRWVNFLLPGLSVGIEV